MPVFKLFFEIIKKNFKVIMIGIIISLVMSIFMAFSLRGNDDFNKENIKVTIIDKDHGEMSKALKIFMEQQVKVVKINPKEIDDALYFLQIEQAITIPKGFTKELSEKKLPKLVTQNRPDSSSEMYLNHLINRYLSTFQFYQQLFPDKNTTEIAKMTKENLNQKVVVEKNDKLYKRMIHLAITGIVFSILAYGMFTAIFQAIGLVSLKLNDEAIKQRNQCSPVSEKKRSRSFYLAAGLFSFGVFVFSIAINYFISGKVWDQTFWLFVLNGFVFFLSVVSFSVFVSKLIRSTEALSGIGNVVILGSCFIGGVFVPQFILPDIVNQVASVTPTYWLVKNNTLLSSQLTLHSDDLKKFGFYLFIQFAFTVVFVLATLVVSRETGGKRKLVFN